MSANGKRVLPTTAASTAALVPFSHPGYAGAHPGRSGDNDELIDQLVGGLVQADRNTKTEANFFNQNEDTGNYGRTYSIDDEEIDEPPVPIPSTWQAPTTTKEPSWLAEQLKASAYGFVIGLFVVIPAVMLLTGQTERLPSWAAISQYASATATEFGLQFNADGEQSPNQSVATTSAPSAPVSSSPPASTPVASVSQPETTSTSVPAPAPASTTAEPTKTVAVVSQSSVSQQDVTNQSQTASSSLSVNSAESSPRTAAANNDNQGEQVVALAAPKEAAQLQLLTPQQQDVDPAAPPPAAPAAIQSEAADSTAGVAQPSAQIPTTATQPAEGQQTAALTRTPEPTGLPSLENLEQTPPAPSSAAAESSQPADAMPDALTIETAQFLMKNGKMDDGRVILAKLASRGNAAAIFGLAESYDPNVLAAWGASGAVAEPEKAKIFYSMALSQGFEGAIARLKGLE